MQHAEGYVPIQDGLRLYYHSIGDGPDTVLLASACSLDIDLAPLAQGRQLVFYDQRGRGRSDPDPDPSHIWTDYEPRDLEAVREHFGLERVSLIGWPYNGGVTALYAMEHPDRVNRLVLMCSIAPRQPAPYDDDDAQQRKADSRLDPAAVKRLEEMRQAGLESSDPVACAREHRRVYLPRQMGKPEALARSSQDPSLFPNEWLTNRSEHWKRHFPDSSWERDWRSRAAWLDIPTIA